MNEKKQLPTIAELQAMEVTDQERTELFKVWLNQQPPKAWLKQGQYKNQYLPIEAVTYLLNVFFPKWWTSNTVVTFNNNLCCVKLTLNYLSPIDGSLNSCDGIAVTNLTLSEKTGLFNQNSDGIVASCKSEAIKNAAKEIGNIFGRTIANPEFVALYNKQIDNRLLLNPKATEK